MAFFKEVFIFSLGSNSWSEIYYSSANTIAEAATFFPGFIKFRTDLLAPDAVLNKIRISDVLNLRSTVLININRGGTSPSALLPDVTQTAAVITLNSTARPANRQLWMRGLPDDYVMRDDAGRDNPPTAFLKAVQLWIIALNANNYQIPSLNKVAVPPAQPNVYSRITQAAPTAGQNTTTLTFANTYTPQPNNRVIISQCSPKALPGINGHWTLLPLTATTGVINYVMPSANPVILNKGQMRPEIYNFGVINKDTSQFNFYRSRKTGRSFLGGRGRRTAVRIRSL